MKSLVHNDLIRGLAPKAVSADAGKVAELTLELNAEGW